VSPALAALLAEDDAAIDAAEACARFADTADRIRARRRLWAALRSTLATAESRRRFVDSLAHASKLAPADEGAEVSR
jgi:hypothetical protein